jgi:hypothetical protein
LFNNCLFELRFDQALQGSSLQFDFCLDSLMCVLPFEIE